MDKLSWSETGSRACRLLTEEQGLQGCDPCQGVIGGRGPGGSWRRLGRTHCDWVWQCRPYPRRGRGTGPRAGHRGSFQYKAYTERGQIPSLSPFLWDLFILCGTDSSCEGKKSGCLVNLAHSKWLVPSEANWRKIKEGTSASIFRAADTPPPLWKGPKVPLLFLDLCSDVYR